MSFGEMLLLGVIAIVVVGPRNLPSFLRNAGQMIGRLRRMANEIRTESGIDEILEVEGIRSEIDNFKRLASGQIDLDNPSPNVVPDREREYPRGGPDAYDAYSEDVLPYMDPAEALSDSSSAGSLSEYRATEPGSPPAETVARSSTDAGVDPVAGPPAAPVALAAAVALAAPVAPLASVEPASPSPSAPALPAPSVHGSTNGAGLKS